MIPYTLFRAMLCKILYYCINSNDINVKNDGKNKII